MKNTCELVKKVEDLIRSAAVPRWLHHFGPKTYETWQHIIVLLVKTECQLGYRRAVRLLRSLGMIVPSYSAIAKFVSRHRFLLWQHLFAATTPRASVRVAAIDSTGLSRTNPSYHYLKRIDRDGPVGKPVKLSMIVDTKTKKILAARVRALGAHDVRDVDYLVKRLPAQVEILLGDKGYDSEKVHLTCKKKGIRAIIPARTRCRKGRHRKKMRDNFPQKIYNNRPIIETVNSALKRLYGGSVRCHKAHTQRAEIFLRLIQYNLFAWLTRDFQRSHWTH